MKRDAVPYDAPYIVEFDRISFRSTVKRERLACHELLSRLPSKDLSRNACWSFIRCPRTAAEYRRSHIDWQPKVYVCVGPKDYFATVRRFIRLFEHEETRWKYYDFDLSRWPAGYGRPDKIVFYPRHVSDVAPLVARLRRAIRGASFHEMRHAARAAELGLERSGEGIRIGCDPMFLPDGSWRIYRTIVCAFADMNQEYLSGLRGGIARWHARMNVATTHEGPLSLDPPKTDVAYVRNRTAMDVLTS